MTEDILLLLARLEVEATRYEDRFGRNPTTDMLREASELIRSLALRPVPRSRATKEVTE